MSDDQPTQRAERVATNAAEDAKAAVSDFAQRAGAQVSDIGNQAYERGTQAARYVGHQIEEEPLIAMLAAGAVGILIGFLIGRPTGERVLNVRGKRIAYRFI